MKVPEDRPYVAALPDALINLRYTLDTLYDTFDALYDVLVLVTEAAAPFLHQDTAESRVLTDAVHEAKKVSQWLEELGERPR